MDKAIIFTIIGVVALGLLFWGSQSGFFAKNITSNPNQTPLPAGIVLFFGDGCPHCKNVEDYITLNNIEQKVKFTRLEVPFNNKTSPQLEANAVLMIKLAQSCNLDASNGVGIPFLYDGSGKCIGGDVDSINFFKNEAGIK